MRANGRPRRYGEVLSTPEQLRVDPEPTWTVVVAFAAQQQRQFKLKTLGPVLARIAGIDHPVRIVVNAPLAYRLRQGDKLLLRNPAYLICTDPTLSLEAIRRPALPRAESPASRLLQIVVTPEPASVFSRKGRAGRISVSSELNSDVAERSPYSAPALLRAEAKRFRYD